MESDQAEILSQPEEVITPSPTDDQPSAAPASSEALITRIDKASVHKICAGQVILDLANVAKVSNLFIFTSEIIF
jgi:hypothetical protein